MQIGDVLAWPLTKVNWYFTTWTTVVLLTVIPGTLLCLLTLGGFRYFNLMGKLCDYLTDRDIAGQEQQWK